MTDEPDKTGKSGAIGLTVAVVTNDQIVALLDGVNALVSALTAISEQLRRIERKAGPVAGTAHRREGGENDLGITEIGSDAELPDRPKIGHVAAWLGFHPNTIYIWARKGEIPCRRVGGSYLFDKSVLIEWAGSDFENPEPAKKGSKKSGSGK
jgi:excisionase family DNA binding protein